MFEPTTNATTRRAFQAAHAERARAFQDAFNWLFRTSR